MVNAGGSSLPAVESATIPATRSVNQLLLLEDQRQKLLRAFAYHPAITLTPIDEGPTTRYLLEYRVRSLVRENNGPLRYTAAVAVELLIPSGYPVEPARCRPLTPVFHPNIAADGVHFSEGKGSGESAIELVMHVGKLLAWRAYDADAVVNNSALQWLAQNPSLAPLDRHADFTVTCGGKPLDRIGQLGFKTLSDLRQSMERLLLAFEGKATVDVATRSADFCRRARGALGVLIEPDVPEPLRSPAAEMSRQVADLTRLTPSWEQARRMRMVVEQFGSEIAAFLETARKIEEEVNALAAMVPVVPRQTIEAEREIPPLEKLRGVQLRLPGAIQETERRALGLREAPTRDKRPPSPPPEGDGPLFGQLTTYLAQTSAMWREAEAKSKAALAAVDPILTQARRETRALETIVKWVEFIDLVRRSVAIEQRLIELGPAALGGYFIQLPDGRFGPFQIEQEVALDTATIAVTTVQPGEIEVIDTIRHLSIGRGKAGNATVSLAATEDSAATAMMFKLAERCEEAELQLNYCINQTTETLNALLAADTRGARTWCAEMIRVFADPLSQTAARAEHRKAVHRWNALIRDLNGLSRFKARMATHYLVARAARDIPGLLAEREEESAAVQDSDRAIAIILGQAGRDEQTGRPIIPPQNAASFRNHTREKQSAQRRLRRIDGAIKGITVHLRSRLAWPRLCGRPEVPQFQRLPSLSEELAATVVGGSDETLKAAVAALSAQLKTPLLLNLTPPPPAPPPQRWPTFTGGLPALIAGDAPPTVAPRWVNEAWPPFARIGVPHRPDTLEGKI